MHLILVAIAASIYLLVAVAVFTLRVLLAALLWAIGWAADRYANRHIGRHRGAP